MSISASGSLAARNGGSTSPILSVLDVTICPTDIDVHPLC
jgi:hypothetical protein